MWSEDNALVVLRAAENDARAMGALAAKAGIEGRRLLIDIDATVDVVRNPIAGAIEETGDGDFSSSRTQAMVSSMRTSSRASSSTTGFFGTIASASSQDGGPWDRESCASLIPAPPRACRTSPCEKVSPSSNSKISRHNINGSAGAFDGTYDDLIGDGGTFDRNTRFVPRETASPRVSKAEPRRLSRMPPLIRMPERVKVNVSDA
jgi:hypothetical protein